MKFSMRLFKRKNGYYYYEIERGRPRSLNTKNKKEAQKLYNGIKRKALRGRLEKLDGVKRTTLKKFKEIFFQRHTDIDEVPVFFWISFTVNSMKEAISSK